MRLEYEGFDYGEIAKRDFIKATIVITGFISWLKSRLNMQLGHKNSLDLFKAVHLLS